MPKGKDCWRLAQVFSKVEQEELDTTVEICKGCGRRGDGLGPVMPQIVCTSCGDSYHWLCAAVNKDRCGTEWNCPRCEAGDQKEEISEEYQRCKVGDQRKEISEEYHRCKVGDQRKEISEEYQRCKIGDQQKDICEEYQRCKVGKWSKTFLSESGEGFYLIGETGNLGEGTEAMEELRLSGESIEAMEEWLKKN